MKYILRIVDFETTGIPSADEMHSVIESAYVDICAERKTIVKKSSFLVIPTTETTVQSRAVHHIDPDLAMREGVSWEDAENALKDIPSDTTVVYVAHNADFEKKFFNPENSTWIDTYKVALVVYPDAPGHSNQVLKYYLDIKDAADHHPPHRALPDCNVTTEILLKMSEKKTFNEMVKISREPAYLTKITFGKHRGQKFEDLPKNYLQWISGQKDMDAAVIAAAKRCL